MPAFEKFLIKINRDVKSMSLQEMEAKILCLKLDLKKYIELLSNKSLNQDNREGLEAVKNKIESEIASLQERINNSNSAQK